MESGQARDRGDLVSAVSQLIADFGVAGVVALIAEITEQEADYLLLSGERQKAARCMRDVRVLQRAVQMLES
jgi:hypothetical protein